MSKFMLTMGLLLASLTGLMQLYEVAQSVPTKPVIAREADYKEFVCSTDEQIQQAIDWLDSHGYSGIAAEKVADNLWKVFGNMGPDNRQDHRPRPVCE
jgi:hypothetical protein